MWIHWLFPKSFQGQLPRWFVQQSSASVSNSNKKQKLQVDIQDSFWSYCNSGLNILLWLCYAQRVTANSSCWWTASDKVLTKVLFVWFISSFLSVVSGKSVNPTITSTRTAVTLWKHGYWSGWRFGAGLMPPARCTCPSSVRKRWMPHHREMPAPL